MLRTRRRTNQIKCDIRASTRHIRRMAEYQIICDGPETFMVEITFPSGHLQLVAGFSTEDAAQTWVVVRQAANAKAEPRA